MASVVGQHHRDAAAERDDLGIRRPVRRGQQHFVARVAQHLERVVDGVLAAVGDERPARPRRRRRSRAWSCARSPPAARAARASASSGGSGLRGRPRPRPRRWRAGSGSRARRRRSRSRSRPRPSAPWPWRRRRASPTPWMAAMRARDASHGPILAWHGRLRPAIRNDPRPNPAIWRVPPPSLVRHAAAQRDRTPRRAALARRARCVGGFVVRAAATGRRRPRQGRRRRKAFIVVDAGTGAVLTADNMHEALPPASTAKIMTALVAVERLAPDADDLGRRPNAAGPRADQDRVDAGDELAVRPDAMASMMMVSANDAAYAHRRRRPAASLDGFADRRRTRRRSGYGMQDSTFTDPGGPRRRHVVSRAGRR